jgi:hypothetical protein
LPPVLLEQLLSELSTLASVYHKPPESFVGKGRFGAEAIQRAAIQEQRQNAADNPIAASVAAAAAAANGTGTGAPQSNIENLLDIDFDGAAPASADAATPDRMASPVSVGGMAGPPPGGVATAGAAGGGMADIMGLFDAPVGGAPGPVQAGGGAMGDLMSGFAGMDLSGTSAPPPPGQQLGHQQKGTSGGDDLLGLL